MALIKDIYSASFIDRFGTYLEQVVPSFDKKKFASLASCVILNGEEKLIKTFKITP